MDKPADDEWRTIVDFAERNFNAYSCGLPPVVLDKLRKWHETLSAGCLVKAMEATIDAGAVKNGAPDIRYLKAICKRWIEHGVTQVEDIEPLQRDHEYQKQKDKQARERDTGAFAPLSDEDKQKLDEVNKQLAGKFNLPTKAVKR